MKLLIAGLATCLLVASQAAVFGASYIKFDGIEGESNDSGRNEWIEIKSWSMGVNNPANCSGRQDPGATIRDFVIRKKPGKATPKLYEACVRPDHEIPRVIIEETQTEPDGVERVYRRYILEDVRITNMDILPNPGSELVPFEEISLSFDGLRIIHLESPGADGEPGRKVEFGWSFCANEELPPLEGEIDTTDSISIN